jgi:hypothetical protein
MATRSKGKKRRAEEEPEENSLDTIVELFKKSHNEVLTRLDLIHGSIEKLSERVDTVEVKVQESSAKITENCSKISQHDSELESIRVEMRKYSLIFVGLSEDPNMDLWNQVQTIISDVLELDDKMIIIDKIHPIGPRSAKVKFVSESSRDTVFYSRKKLREKKTNYYINEDLPPITQQRRYLLRQEEKMARNLGRTTRLLGDRLVIDNISYEINNEGVLVQVQRPQRPNRPAHSNKIPSTQAGPSTHSRNSATSYTTNTQFSQMEDTSQSQ